MYGMKNYSLKTSHLEQPVYEWTFSVEKAQLPLDYVNTDFINEKFSP